MLNQVMENGGAGIAETTEKAYSSFVAGVLAGLTHRRADGAPPAPDGSSNHAADSQHPVQLAAELIALAGELMAPHQRIQQPEAALVTTSLPTIESILCAKKAQPSPPSSSAVFARDAASMRIQMALQSTIAAAAVEGAGATHAPFATPPQPPSSAGAPGAQAGPPPLKRKHWVGSPCSQHSGTQHRGLGLGLEYITGCTQGCLYCRPTSNAAGDFTALHTSQLLAPGAVVGIVVVTVVVLESRTFCLNDDDNHHQYYQ